MFLLKYKHGDDVFYRITEKKNPSGKSIAFEKPVAPPIVTSLVNQALSKIEATINDESNKEKEEMSKEPKKMAFSIIQNFLKDNQ